MISQPIAALRGLFAGQEWLAHMLPAINAHAIVSITDASGTIIRVNERFSQVSGYSEAELLGSNHRMLKSGLHDSAFYADMWRTIGAGQIWRGEICNRRKDGSLYWVDSTITPMLDAEGRIQGYISLRTDISRSRSNELLLQGLAGIGNCADAEFPAAAVEWLARSLQVRLAFISVIDPMQPEFLRPLAVWDGDGLRERHLHRIAGSPCEQALRDGAALHAEGLAQSFALPLTRGDAAIESYLGVAFSDPDGAVRGVVGIMHDKPLLDARGRQEWLSVLAPRLGHILQRERLQRELQQREANYRTLTQNIPGMAYRAAANWELEFVSGALPVCGHDEAHFLGTRGRWLALVHPDDRGQVMDGIHRLQATPCSLIQQYRIRHRDGSQRWVSDHKRSRFSADGSFAGVDGVLFDVTRVKQDELANAQDRERLTRSQRYANIGTWDWNIRTSELHWTDRIPALFGYPEGGLATTYDNFMAAVHPDDRQLVNDAVQRCIQDMVPYEVEHRVLWPDGTVRWLLERGDVIRDDKGEPLHMLGVVQDIDDRKRAELAMVQSEARLYEAQALAHIGNWSADFRSGELAWSEEIYRIFGRDPAHFVPSVAAFRNAVHPADEVLVAESEQAAARSGVLDVIHRIIRPDGEVRYVHELGRVERDADGQVVGMLGTVQDVTQQTRVQHALIKAREEAERANRAKTEFLSSMSHELRTPMNAILGFSQLLESDQRLDAVQRDSVGEIRRAGSHLLQLINEVLDLARIESGRLILSTEPVVLAALLDDCVALVQPLAELQGVNMAILTDCEVAVLADYTRLKQVLLNLLSNAVKYNRSGGSVDILVSRPGPGRVRLEVRDTGLGIAAEVRHRVFEAFTRLHEDQAVVEGTGIGLTITRKLVELMGGSIGFDSRVGEGSCFHVELPLAEGWQLQSDAGVAAADAPTGNSGPAVKQYRVLLVDDNPANLRLVSRILERVSEVELLSACSGSLGLELARAHNPHLILLDINMPDMDGYRLLQLLRESPVFAATPVIAITANALPRDVEKGKAAGFADYLTKPLDINDFIMRVRQRLGLPLPEAGASAGRR